MSSLRKWIAAVMVALMLAPPALLAAPRGGHGGGGRGGHGAVARSGGHRGGHAGARHHGGTRHRVQHGQRHKYHHRHHHRHHHHRRWGPGTTYVAVYRVFYRSDPNVSWTFYGSYGNQDDAYSAQASLQEQGYEAIVS